MLNIFYLYSIIWGGVLILYSFGWSDILVPVTPGVYVFFISTILVSAVLGFVFRKDFRYRKADTFPESYKLMTALIVFAAAMEYVYCRQVPLFSIIQKTAVYAEFTGIPTLHPIIWTFASF